jgi:predicted nucleotidyltransferase
MTVPIELRPLIDRIKSRMHPESMWLFGSRARGEDRPDSDWDIVVALPDDADPSLLDPLVGWSIQREVGIPATILSTTSGALAESWGAAKHPWI